MGDEHIYRLADLVKRFGRDKSTFIRWEAAGKIPVAKRDRRGWRYYTPGDFVTVARFVETENGLPAAVASESQLLEDTTVPNPPTIVSLADDGRAVARAEAIAASMPPYHAADVGSQDFALPTMPRGRDESDHDTGDAASRAGGLGTFIAAVASFGIAFVITTAALDDSAIQRESSSRPPRGGLPSVITDQVTPPTSAINTPAAGPPSALQGGTIFLQQRFVSMSDAAVEAFGRDILAIAGGTSDLAQFVVNQTAHSITRMGGGFAGFADDFGQTVSESVDDEIARSDAFIETAHRIARVLRVAGVDLAGIPRGAADEFRGLAAFARWQFGEMQRAAGDYGVAASAIAEDGLGVMRRALANAAHGIADDAEQIGAWGEDATGRMLPAAFGTMPNLAAESAGALPENVSILVGTGVFPEAETASFVLDGRVQAASKILLVSRTEHQYSFVAARIEPARGFWVTTQAPPTVPVEFDYVIITPQSARPE